MAGDNNRLLLELSKNLRDINFDVLSPTLPDLTIDDLDPVLRLVARSRASYIKEIFDLASVLGDELPSPEQISQLRQLREAFEELLKGAQALETTLQRGYINLDASRSETPDAKPN